MAHLVFQTAFPGDLFLSIPLLKRIREWDPKTPLALACRPGLGEFFLKSGLVDEVIEIDKKSKQGRKESLKRIRAKEWDVVFVPHESVRTALWMTRVHARRKVGFRKWWNFPVYDYRVTKPMDYPDALRQMSLLTAVDSDFAEDFSSPEIQALVSPRDKQSPYDFSVNRIPEWASMEVKRGRADAKRVFLAPGSVWATKRWTAEGYLQLARELIERGFSVELVGSGDEKKLCDEIAAKVKGVVNHAGKTSLSDLVELFTHGTALICNDSGAMHAAAAACLPTVAIFGPTTLAQGFRPWQNRAVVVQRDLECRPCGKHGSAQCPIGTHECMVKIEASDVLSALDKLLSH